MLVVPAGRGIPGTLASVGDWGTGGQALAPDKSQVVTRLTIGHLFDYTYVT